MLITFLHGLEFGFIGSIPVAGPVAAMVLKHGLDGQYTAGRTLALGAAIPEACYATLAFWGMAGILERFPALDLISKGVAALALLVIGGLLVTRHAGTRRQSTRAEITPPRLRWAFGTGLVAGFLNVTLVATYSGAIVFFNGLGSLTIVESAAPAFGLGAGCGSLTWFSTLLAVMKRQGVRPGSGAYRRLAPVAGWGLLAFGAYLGHQLVVLLG